MVAPVVSVAICFEGQFMTNKENFRLCGGTFFTLLLRARKQRMGVREHYKGMSDGMADPMLLMDLVEIANRAKRMVVHICRSLMMRSLPVLMHELKTNMVVASLR